ncbi:MAG TPA: C4-type zinc ribbon domain-containing protein [Capillibacterium sp.]
MTGNNQALSLLYQYQEVRRRLAACEASRAEPEREKTIGNLRERLRAAEAATERLAKERARLERENREAEEECRLYQENLRELEAMLYSGKITAPKELAQLERRIADYRKAKADREEEILDRLYQLEAKAAELVSAQKKAAKLQRELEAAHGAEAKRVTSLEDQCAQLQKELSVLEEALPEDLKEYYRRSAAVLRGIVVSPVENGLCGFCHMILPPAVLAKVKKGGAELTVCENCGRGLFYQQ